MGPIWSWTSQLEWFLNPLISSVSHVVIGRWALSIRRTRPVWDESLLCHCSKTCNARTCSSSRWLLGNAWGQLFFEVLSIQYVGSPWICKQKLGFSAENFQDNEQWSAERDRDRETERDERCGFFLSFCYLLCIDIHTLIITQHSHTHTHIYIYILYMYVWNIMVHISSYYMVSCFRLSFWPQNPWDDSGRWLCRRGWRLLWTRELRLPQPNGRGDRYCLKRALLLALNLNSLC